MERPVSPLTVVRPQPMRVVDKGKVSLQMKAGLVFGLHNVGAKNLLSTMIPLNVRSIHPLDAVGTAVRHNGNEGLVTKRRLF